MLEQYLTSPTAIWTTFFIVAALSGAAVDALGRAAWKLRDLGRSWIIIVPHSPGALAEIHRVNLKRGEWTRKHGEEGETVIAHGDAAYPTTKGPLHLISTYGANLVAPTKDEAQDANGNHLKNKPSIWQRFRIWDPLTYWRACRENDMEDLYSAQKEKDHWAVKLAPVAIILFVGMLGFLGFILWKIYPLLQRVGN